jgi:hypothetical protein
MADRTTPLEKSRGHGKLDQAVINANIPNYRQVDMQGHQAYVTTSQTDSDNKDIYQKFSQTQHHIRQCFTTYSAGNFQFKLAINPIFFQTTSRQTAPDCYSQGYPFCLDITVKDRHVHPNPLVHTHSENFRSRPYTRP